MKSKLKKLATQNTLVALVMLFAAAAVVAPLVNADSMSQLQQEINQLEEANEHSHDNVSALTLGAADIEAAIAKLRSRIGQLQAQIKANQEKSAQLKEEIREAEAELQRQRDILGENIKTMYLEGDITMLEMLASSHDLSEFVDKQEYRNSVQKKIKDQVDKIADLKVELQGQRKEVERLIEKDKELREELSAQKAEQDRLLSLNKAQQARENAKIAKNNEKIQELRDAQAALAARLAAGRFVSLGPISQGDVIGTVGNTGFSTGAHLHLEARNSSGGLANPNNFLGRSWIRPVSGGYISQGYGVYNTWYVSDYHPGIDYAGVTGNPVSAVADGQVISRGCSSDSPFFNGSPAYGYAVVIQHRDGNFSIYAHMNPPSSGNYAHCSSSYGF